MKIRLRVSCTLGPAGAVVDCADSTAERLIRRRVAEPAPKAKPKRKTKPAKPTKG